MGGHGGRPSGYVLEISSRAEAPFDDARGCDDNSKLTDRLTLKVSALAENKKLTKKSKNRDFWTQQTGGEDGEDGLLSRPVRIQFICKAEFAVWLMPPSRAGSLPQGICAVH
ncbi:hypothetical protein HFK74_10900|uniref:hypothetical protein n=1 Tax=Pseudomonas sp. SbOxS1 TaxID=2723884 RepID=UPI0015D37A3F|nr:hypothetical protein [Pseudomonas sp. SbOxS1]NYU03209.1 hypothetical protein [Pseudomonas sp. SbOxS1]